MFLRQRRTQCTGEHRMKLFYSTRQKTTLCVESLVASHTGDKGRVSTVISGFVVSIAHWLLRVMEIQESCVNSHGVQQP